MVVFCPVRVVGLLRRRSLDRRRHGEAPASRRGSFGESGRPALGSRVCMCRISDQARGHLFRWELYRLWRSIRGRSRASSRSMRPCFTAPWGGLDLFWLLAAPASVRARSLLVSGPLLRTWKDIVRFVLDSHSDSLHPDERSEPLD